MTDISAALTAGDLGEFEGSVVLGTAIEIPAAGGGLRDALAIDPQIMHKDDEVTILLRGPVGKIRFDPVKDSDGVTRVHVVGVAQAAIVSGDVFDQTLASQAEKIALAKEAAEGTQRLPFDEELHALHEQGAHAGGLVAGCADCDLEVAKGEAEAAEDDPGE